MREIGIESTKPNYLSEIFRSTGSGMLWLMILLVLGGLYLSVSAKTAQLGREVIVQTDEVRQKTLIRNEKSAQLAELTSPSRMRVRAESKGYRDANLNDIAYSPLESAILEMDFIAPAPDTYIKDHNQLLSPAYTETLVDGVRRWLGVGEIE
jgi:hypothetical protein